MARIKREAHKHTSCTTLREQLSKDEARKESPAAGGIKKPSKYKPGAVALRDIRRYQKPATDLLIKQAPFRRIVREISQSFNLEMRFQARALDILQEAAEAYLLRVMEDIDLRALRALLAKRLRGHDNDERLAKKT